LQRTDRTAVLDAGYVQLIDRMGAEESIIEAARMSTSGGFVSWDPYPDHPKGDDGLLTYLYREGHHTPFEMCELLVEVQLPIFVAREWMRSRTLSYNELSARYAQMPNLHYVPPMDRMVQQSKGNKQGSALEPLDPLLADSLVTGFRDEQQDVYDRYERALESGLVREVARVNTPVARYTRMRVKGNLRNWLHFLGLRMAPNAQQEIRVYAEAVAKIVQHNWPRTYALFEEWDLKGERVSRTQLEQQKLVRERLKDLENHLDLVEPGWRG
jgi:thymidylate synthase (FAD)